MAVASAICSKLTESGACELEDVWDDSFNNHIIKFGSGHIVLSPPNTVLICKRSSWNNVGTVTKWHLVNLSDPDCFDQIVKIVLDGVDDADLP